MKIAVVSVVIAASVLFLVTPSRRGVFPRSAGTGVSPVLPEPTYALIPVINIAPVTGWPSGTKPVAAEGLSVNVFASGLRHPRWIYVLPNDDILVAETNRPAKTMISRSCQGIKGWYRDIKEAIRTVAIKRAGAHVVSPDRITLLRDTNGDGVADMRTTFLENLYSPFGMVLIDDYLYVANTDAIIRFPYVRGETKITARGVKFMDLTFGTHNHHWTKNIIANHNGSKLYVSVGSNSNVAENGLDEEIGRAAIWEVDLTTGKRKIFASGLRNPVGMSLEPETGVLWTVVNERDELGNNLVPDYLTSVKQNAFYGWPYSYFGQHIDIRVTPENLDMVEKAIVPDYALGSHVASLGLAFSENNLLPEPYRNGAFIGEHGSWNRTPFAGYKVVFVPFAHGKPFGKPLDILTGFLNPDGYAYGRPVGVALDKTGALMVADDVGNTIWRVVNQ